MKKYISKAAFFCIATSLLFSFFACKESQKQIDLSQPNFSHVDTLILNTIASVDWRSVYYGSDEQREVIVTRLIQFVDSLEQVGDLNELGADTYRGIIYNNAYMRLDAEEWFSRAITHNSRKDREQRYYNYAGYELANLLYSRHNYEGFLRVAVPVFASMDSLGTYLRIDHKIDLYSLLGCCYLKLEQPEKAREAVLKARDFGRQVLAEDSSDYIYQSFINYYARIKDAYVRVKDFEGARNWMAFTDSIGSISCALQSDDVKDTLNYADIYQIINKVMQKPSCLLEHVVGRIGQSIFEAFPEAEIADVEITKCNPPMRADCEGATVYCSLHR